MNTTNQTFNWSRFMAALRKEFVENKRIILFGIIGTYLLLTICMIFSNISDCYDNQLVNNINNNVPQKNGYIGLVITCIVCPSLAFRNLRSKSGRVSLFTLPASTFEKFLVNITIYGIGAFVMYHICAQLADSTRIAVLLPFWNEKLIVPGTINFLNLVNDTVTGIGTSLVTALTTVLGVNLLSCLTMYFLGSILWPRLSLLKTFLAGQILTAIVIIIGLVWGGMMFTSTEQVQSYFSDHLDTVTWIWGSWYIVETLVFGILAWFVFKRKDIISTKWWK